jgi:hypothetical protein
MLRRGMLRPHANNEEGQDGPTEEKRVYNRGERCKHDAEWEEPLLKQIRHLKEMTMCDENTRKIASDKCNRTITRRTRGAHDKCMCSSRSERQA